MKKRNGRTYVDNALINDTSLSVDARFLYIYMSSQNEEWKFFRSAMCNVMCCSRKRFDKAIKELISVGLIQKGDKKTQSSKGVKGFGAVKYNVVSFGDHTASDDTNSADTKSDQLRRTNNKKNNSKEEKKESFFSEKQKSSSLESTLEERRKKFAKEARKYQKQLGVSEEMFGDYYTYNTAADKNFKMRFESDPYFSIPLTMKKWIELN